jgi:Na+/proline symporter
LENASEGLTTGERETSRVTLSPLDWAVVAAYFALNLGIGLYYRSRAGQSTSEFFLGGRDVSWWLAGTSMVATTFAADTPLVVCGLVARYGIAGNWLWWCMVASNMLTVFVFARLWRRAGVMTDVEFAEIRYSGRPAAFLRGFKALYLGIPINCIVLGWVNLAIVKILMTVFGVTKGQALGVCMAILVITAFITTLSGLWGVLVTDFIQFFIKMTMVTVLAYYAVEALGGMAAMKLKLLALDAARGSQGSILAFVPDLHSQWMPLNAFLVFIGIQWWASWYPGSEPGGGGYVAQRIFCARDERESLLATLWFTIAHYALRPWPWILAGLASAVLYPQLADKEVGYVKVIIDYLPVSLRGVMIAAFAAAYMSTVATQLNWGASYVINDFYRRFMRQDADERHYVTVSQAVTGLLMVLSGIVTYNLEGIGQAWKILLGIGAGTGGVLILRWFWWRINAWSEVSSLMAAFVTSLLLRFVWGVDQDAPQAIVITVLVTTAVWLAVTLLTPPEPDEVLLAFYRRVRPDAALWGPIVAKASDVQPARDGLENLIDWLVGCTMIYCALFGIGKLLLLDVASGSLFMLGAVLSGAFIYWHLSRRGWSTVFS